MVNSLMVVPVLACFSRAVVGDRRASGAAWLSVAMVTFAAGTLIFTGWTQFQATPPVPSPADIAYLAFYPCVGAAVVCLLRSERASPGRALWLDASLGAAAAAMALAVILMPVLAGGGEGAAILVGAAYTVADLLLIAAIAGVLAVRGLRGGSMWVWLGIGLATFCAADVAYALQVAAGTYEVGATMWGSLWVIGLTIAAFAIWRPEKPVPTEPGRSMAMLIVPTLATVAAIGTLAVFSLDESPVVVSLATVILGLTVVRTLIAFRQVRRLSDAHRQAVTDDLTGLGNRRALFEQGQGRLEQGKPEDRVALMLIDINDFKEVNDTLGHQAGDELLRKTAERLAERFRQADLLVRLGGDEFALVFDLAAGEDGRQSAERILERLSQPMVIDGARLRVEASAGVAECRRIDADISELLRQADVAMYAAKADGARVRFYDVRLDELNRARLQTIDDLHAAIADGQFVLHYQPVVELPGCTVVGAEALLRWQHPTRGLLYPDTFLPLVEQCGLMSAVSRTVLRMAIGQLSAWRDAGTSISVAVNLSASDLLDEHLAQHILTLLSEYDVPVEALSLEITESVLMTDPERAHEVVKNLRGLGLRIAVDDFGTGYCSLAYLRDLPVDVLKIDQTFIETMCDDSRGAAIVRSTIELAHALGLEVVAEGVEHEHPLELAQRMRMRLRSGLPLQPSSSRRCLCRARRNADSALHAVGPGFGLSGSSRRTGLVRRRRSPPGARR